MMNLSTPWQLSALYNSNVGFCTSTYSTTPDATGYLVMVGGEIVAEEYVPPATMDTKVYQWSATKSWASLLMGTLVDRGRVGLNDTLGDIFPEEEDWSEVEEAWKKKQATLYELLTMTSGFRDDPEAGERAQLTWKQAINFVDFSFRLQGEYFYCSACHILGHVIQQITGKTPFDYAMEEEMHLGGHFGTIFGQMGIAEEDMDWIAQWSAHGITTNLRTMAKLGALYLQEGMASETSRIVSQEWVRASSLAHVDDAFIGVGYGYQWWVDMFKPWETAQGHVGPEVYCAWGSGGQFVCVCKELDAAIVIMTDKSELNSLAQSSALFSLYEQLVAGEFATPMAC